MQIWLTRQAGHCRRSKDDLISDVLIERPVKTYLQQLCTDTGCSLEDQPKVIDDRDGWREKELGKSVQAARGVDDDDDTNSEHRKRKDETNTVVHKRTFNILYTLCIYQWNAPTAKTCAHCPMKKQYVERVQKWEKLTVASEIRLFCSKSKSKKRSRIGFCQCYVTQLGTPSWHAHSLNSIVIVPSP